jgi:hypothetical protein
MPRHVSRWKEASGRQLLLAAWACLLLRSGPVPAQNPPGAQEQELRRQLQAERAALKALTYQADMRKADQLVEREDWSGLRTVLEKYRPPMGETDLRSWEWHFLDGLARKGLGIANGQKPTPHLAGGLTP